MSSPGSPQTTSNGMHGLESTTGAMFLGLPLGLVIVDNALRPVHCNEAATRIFGRFRDLAECLTQAQLDDTSIDWSFELRQVIEGNRARTFPPLRCLGHRDRPYTLVLTALPLPAGENGQPRLMLALEDETDRAELERRIGASEGMAAVGRLAARVAHELNNPLDGALRFIGLARRVLTTADATASENADRYLEEARTGLLRMARIVGELLEFSRSTPHVDENGNINTIVDEALRAMRAHADHYGVVVAAGFHDEERMPTLEGAKLFQVCCNLIKNAIDAMPAGGCLTVTTGIANSDVVIRVEDTGVGLPEDVERVFEPFYTTKPAGQGTGLGLAICREYVTQLGGSIVAAPNQPKGAVFTVRFPVASCTPLSGGE